MTDTTENRNYNVPEAGEENWHIPLNENWKLIDADVQTLYDNLANGESGSGDGTAIKGVTKTRTNVGAMVYGGYHSGAFDDGGYGIVFEASNLYIDSVLVDSDLSDVSDSDLTVELRKFEGGSGDPTIVDSTTVTLSGGLERIQLGFTVPEAGAPNADENNEYTLQRGNDEGIPLRRRHVNEDDWSADDYNEHTYSDPPIDFISGIQNSPTAGGDVGPRETWYYFFDWLVGPATARVASPWSTDIDELYVRPTDPEEEFDDVSPRALWIDTS